MNKPSPERAHPFLAEKATQNPFGEVENASGNPFCVAAEPARETLLDETLAEQLYLPTPQLTAGWSQQDDEIFDLQSAKPAELALEVVITWGASVLHVAHLNPPRSFSVGQAGVPEDEVDFVLPSEVLGRETLPLVLVEGDKISVVVPDVAKAEMRRGKGAAQSGAIVDAGVSCATVTRAVEHELHAGMQLVMSLPGVEVRVALVKKAAPIEKGLLANWDWSVPGYFTSTAAMAGALMASLAYFVPPLGLEDESALDQERLLLISQYLDAASERETEKQEDPAPESGDAGGQEAKKAQGAEGQAGKETSKKTKGRIAVKGPRDNQDLQLRRQRALHEASDWGMIGLLNASSLGDPNAPTSIFGGDLSLGSNDISAQGNLFGDAIGESFGGGALGLSGSGSGGGDLYGNGLGAGVGEIGTVGGGRGKTGWGAGRHLGGKGHKARGPGEVRLSSPQVNGHIPPQVIQRIVRQNFGRFRMCYEQGLARNPNLEGRIPVRFIIGSDGAVANASAMGSFPDGGVKSCVASAFYGLSFPPPETGTVRVTYPIMFSPG